MLFWSGKNVLVTGGAGFLGSFIVENLKKRGVPEENIRVPLSQKLDLRKWENCVKASEDIDIVIHLAARVGGIGLNLKYPATLFYDNIKMGINLMEAARLAGVDKYVAIGTVCSYPKFTPVPFKEEDLWNGFPEETNAPYGVAKKMQLVQAQAYRLQYNFNAIFLVPVNLYGPRDNFHLDHSHVIPALIRKMVDARLDDKDTIEVWGSGKPTREFIYVEDASEGILLATEKYNKPEPVNLGTGKEISIEDLVGLIAELTGYTGELVWDKSKPDGQLRRRLNVDRAEQEFDFIAKTDLKEGVKRTIEWYEKNREEIIKKESVSRSFPS